MLEITPETRVIDVGGTLFNWGLLPFRPRLTIVNPVRPPTGLPEDVHWVVGDGCRLPFSDQSFDVYFSNSVIEHLGSWENQRRFARESRRVARRFYVQTPNYWFPIEPHLVAPFIHWLPLSWQRRLIRHFTLFGLLMRPSADACESHLRNTRLLRRGEVATCFPDARIVPESTLGLAKSYIAIGSAAAVGSGE